MAKTQKVVEGMCKEVEELSAKFGEELREEGTMNAKIETVQLLH